MSIKISELPVASSVNSADIVPIVQDGTTKQAQAEMFKPQIETVINSSSTNDKPVGAKAVYDYSAPIKHDSETQEYGVATTTKYGHTKIIDSLDSSSYQVGESLSAYQGAVLKQSIDNINDDIESITDELATKQTISNMTNTLDENSTAEQYPNAQVTFEKYNELLNQIPTATATGNPINVQDSSNLPIKDFALLGNATQADTPTPDTPQDIHVVTGDNTVKVLGKNLFSVTDYTNISLSSQATASSGKTENKLYFTTTAATYSGIWMTKANIFKYIGRADETNNYTISYDVTTANSLTLHTGIASASFIRPSVSAGTTRISFTAKITNNVIIFSYQNRANDYIEISNIMITPENSNVTYEPYTEQTQLLSLGNIELAKIGTYTDRIFKDSGKWYVEKNIEKLVLNGTETWATWNNINDDIGFYSYINTALGGNVENNYNGRALMNLFSEAQTQTSIKDGNAEGMKMCGPYSSSIYLAIGIAKTRLSDYSTQANAVASFKTWLSTNTPILYYILKEPTTTEITDNTLLGQLEELLKKHTNKNVTNISIVPTGTNAEPTGEWEYRVDLGTVIGNINNAIISLGGNV